MEKNLLAKKTPFFGTLASPVTVKIILEDGNASQIILSDLF